MLKLITKVVLNQKSSTKAAPKSKKAMALFAGNLKEFLTIKVKVRNDEYSDQVSRLVVTKCLVICTLLTALDWFHDSFNCLPPPSTSNEENHALELPKDYLMSVCWINGIYVYPELASHMDKCSFYGVPIQLDDDGLLDGDNVLPDVCRRVARYGSRKVNQNCRKLEKLYFTQYQWMPFLIATLGALFYIPYIFFRVINTDLVSLRNAIRHEKVEIEEIVKNFFNRDINSPLKMRFRVFLNVINKCLYFAVNYGTFRILDTLLNHHFVEYGPNWMAWASQNTTRLDFLSRKAPTPGNQMIPTFGMCDIYDTRNGLTRSYVNKYTVICEISSHLLYQYMFVILWILLVLSIVISLGGIVLHLVGHLHILMIVKRKKMIIPIANKLMHREFEYLEFLRRRDLTTYGKVLRRLQTYKFQEEPHQNGGHSVAMEYKELSIGDDSFLNESIT